MLVIAVVFAVHMLLVDASMSLRVHASGRLGVWARLEVSLCRGREGRGEMREERREENGD